MHKKLCEYFQRIVPKLCVCIASTRHLETHFIAYFCCITVNVIVLAYCFYSVAVCCPRFTIIHLCLSIACIVWKHLQNEFISLPLNHLRWYIRHKSINVYMEGTWKEEHKCFKHFIFLLNCIKMSLLQLFSFSLHLASTFFFFLTTDGIIHMDLIHILARTLLQDSHIVRMKIIK